MKFHSLTQISDASSLAAHDWLPPGQWGIYRIPCLILILAPEFLDLLTNQTSPATKEGGTFCGFTDCLPFPAVAVVIQPQLLAVVRQSFSGGVRLPHVSSIFALIRGTCVGQLHFVPDLWQWLVGFTVHLLHLWWSAPTDIKSWKPENVVESGLQKHRKKIQSILLCMWS